MQKLVLATSYNKMEYRTYPETTTLIITSSGPGSGMGESLISTLGPAETMASFMVGMVANRRGAVEKVLIGRDVWWMKVLLEIRMGRS